MTRVHQKWQRQDNAWGLSNCLYCTLFHSLEILSAPLVVDANEGNELVAMEEDYVEVVADAKEVDDVRPIAMEEEAQVNDIVHMLLRV